MIRHIHPTDPVVVVHPTYNEISARLDAFYWHRGHSAKLLVCFAPTPFGPDDWIEVETYTRDEFPTMASVVDAANRWLAGTSSGDPRPRCEGGDR